MSLYLPITASVLRGARDLQSNLSGLCLQCKLRPRWRCTSIAVMTPWKARAVSCDGAAVCWVTSSSCCYCCVGQQRRTKCQHQSPKGITGCHTNPLQSFVTAQMQLTPSNSPLCAVTATPAPLHYTHHPKNNRRRPPLRCDPQQPQPRRASVCESARRRDTRQASRHQVLGWSTALCAPDNTGRTGGSPTQRLCGVWAVNPTQCNRPHAR